MVEGTNLKECKEYNMESEIFITKNDPLPTIVSCYICNGCECVVRQHSRYTVHWSTQGAQEDKQNDHITVLLSKITGNLIHTFWKQRAPSLKIAVCLQLKQAAISTTCLSKTQTVFITDIKLIKWETRLPV